MPAPREILARITDQLFDPAAGYGTLREVCNGLQDFFHTLTGYQFPEFSRQEHISTREGQAVDTRTASLCINDFLRTQRFIAALNEAIADCRRKNPGSPVTVLYAGTGPFATLATPLITRWRPEELQLIAVEVNPASLNLLEKTIKALDMQPYMAALLPADACQLVLPGSLTPDILLSETMKPALEKEPQAALVRHMLPQCKPAAIMIPEAITISVALHGLLALHPDRLSGLGEIWRLDANWVRGLAGPVSGALCWEEEREVDLPVPWPEELPNISLLTDMELYGRYRLGLNESSLTVTHKLGVREEWKDVRKVRFRYRFGINPGFEVVRLP